MMWRKILTAAVFSAALIFQFQPSAQAVVDDTTCWVKDYCDQAGSIDYSNCLRHKIEQGFNVRQQRSCVERIKFNLPANDGGEAVIRITKRLNIDGEQDGDCEGNHDLCGDGISFEIMGNTQSAKVVLDTTGMSDDRCAIKIKGWDMKYSGFTVRSNQPNLVAKYDENQMPNAVICEDTNGDDFTNDYTGLQHEGKGEECGNGVLEGAEQCDAGTGNGQVGSGCSETCTETDDGDADKDGKADDGEDNCSPTDSRDGCSGMACANADQKDCDQDGIGDACDKDWDNDGFNDDQDNCSPNASKAAICNDGSLSAVEKAQRLAESANPPSSAGDPQDNADGDSYGDLCDDDRDGDKVDNDDDNCPSIANEGQEDKDGDDLGEACDSDDSPPEKDDDHDGAPDGSDNCSPANPDHKCAADACANAGQEDLDTDTIGDACDEDKDGDGKTNIEEDEGDPTVCPFSDDEDSDDDTVKDSEDECPCDATNTCNDPGVGDDDLDGNANDTDNCPLHANADQADDDGDLVGNACDPDNPTADTDNDGTLNDADNCPLVVNDGQEDSDGDSVGDVCDANADVVEGDSVDAGTDEGGGGGCFNSLAAAGSRDLLSWVLFAIIAFGMNAWRSVGKDRE